MKFISKEKGITLIALVLTIIVLIILAGVTISVCSGDNGLITKSIEGKKSMTKESIKEIIQVDLVEKTAKSDTTETFNEYKEQMVNKLKDGKLIDNNTKIINGYIIIDDDNIISLYTGDNAVIGNSSEWEYMIYESSFYAVDNIQTGDTETNIDTDYTAINYSIPEQGNENNKVAAITGYKGSSRDIVIPEIIIDNNEIIPVTRLGDYWSAGQNLSTVNVENVKVLDNIKVITAWVFNGNTNLKSISIGNGVEYIHDGAFHGCSNLKDVRIGKNVKWIGHDTFKGTAIENISFPDSIVLLGTKAFENCNGLRILTLGKNINTLGHACFRGCINLEKINFNSTLTTIPSECFAFDNSLKEIIIPSNIRTIEKQAFMYVGHKYDDTNVGYVSNIEPKLEKIVLNEGLQSVGYEAFTCARSVKYNLTIPSTLTTIGTSAFYSFGDVGGGRLYRSNGTLF